MGIDADMEEDVERGETLRLYRMKEARAGYTGYSLFGLAEFGWIGSFSHSDASGIYTLKIDDCVSSSLSQKFYGATHCGACIAPSGTPPHRPAGMENRTGDSFFSTSKFLPLRFALTTFVFSSDFFADLGMVLPLFLRIF